MDFEIRLRELLVPVLGCSGIEEIVPDVSMVDELDADSIDFVEIIYLVEQEFGVVLKTDQLLTGGVKAGSMFEDGLLTLEGAAVIGSNLPDSGGRYKVGMSKMQLFSALTVLDLARIIRLKVGALEGGELC